VEVSSEISEEWCVYRKRVVLFESDGGRVDFGTSHNLSLRHRREGYLNLLPTLIAILSFADSVFASRCVQRRYIACVAWIELARNHARESKGPRLCCA